MSFVLLVPKAREHFVVSALGGGRWLFTIGLCSLISFRCRTWLPFRDVWNKSRFKSERPSLAVRMGPNGRRRKPSVNIWFPNVVPGRGSLATSHLLFARPRQREVRKDAAAMPGAQGLGEPPRFEGWGFLSFDASGSKVWNPPRPSAPRVQMR